MKVKIFSNAAYYELQQEINEFINNSSIKVTDIKFAANYNDYNGYYSAMIIYEEV